MNPRPQAPGAKPSEQDLPVDWRARSQVLEGAQLTRFEARAAYNAMRHLRRLLPDTRSGENFDTAESKLHALAALGLPDEEGEEMKKPYPDCCGKSSSRRWCDTYCPDRKRMNEGDGAAPPPRGAVRESRDVDVPVAWRYQHTVGDFPEKWHLMADPEHAARLLSMPEAFIVEPLYLAAESEVGR